MRQMCDTLFNLRGNAFNHQRKKAITGADNVIAKEKIPLFIS